mmetsp:Transcript_19594/g.40514  ORF Transcript_19594/g.40514 Transcript_19594/m.40514 type:complete len:202 (+) Transcript_19594:48-653(+)
MLGGARREQGLFQPGSGMRRSIAMAMAITGRQRERRLSPWRLGSEADASLKRSPIARNGRLGLGPRSRREFEDQLGAQSFDALDDGVGEVLEALGESSFDRFLPGDFRDRELLDLRLRGILPQTLRRSRSQLLLPVLVQAPKLGEDRCLASQHLLPKPVLASPQLLQESLHPDGRVHTPTLWAEAALAALWLSRLSLSNFA